MSSSRLIESRKVRRAEDAGPLGPVPGRRAAEALGQAMFEDSPIGMAFLDTSGTWEEANPALGEFLGYHPGGLRGRRSADLIVPGDRAADAS